MNVRWRQAGIAAVAAAAFLGFASPAYAADSTDLAVDITGTTIAADASGKFGTLKLKNNGPGALSGVDVTFDISQLTTSKVKLDLPAVCTHEPTKIVCGLPDDALPPAGGSIDVDIPFEREAGATGDAGKLTISATHAGTDTDPANNSKTVDVKVGENGVDLGVIAPDVYQVDADDQITNKPINPGGESLVWVFVGNQGDATADGIKLAITLPAHVTFTEPEPDCTHTAGATTTTCEYDDVTLVPEDQDTKEDDDIRSSLWFFFPVKVAEGAPAPSALTGGVATADAIEIVVPTPDVAKAAAVNTVPRNATEEPPAPEFKDVDPSDNTDGFTVFTAKAGGGGSLPITGARAGLIGGMGAAALVLGSVLFVLARRRRVVLEV